VSSRLLKKGFELLRQAHYELIKINRFNDPDLRPERSAELAEALSKG
jgi:hypothetical protein